MKRFLTYATVVVFWGLFCVAVDHGLNKEARRMDAVKEYNCQHFGSKMNEMYGEATCQ